MKKRLFLSGPSGIGKSTLIKEALGPAYAYAGGFITVRKLREDGGLDGFDLYPAAAGADINAYEGYRFLNYAKDAPEKDNEVFRNQGASLLNEAACYPFAVLDEIGGFEMLIPQFRQSLEELLNSELPIVGVIKGAENAVSLKKRFGLGDRFTAVTDNLRRALCNDADTVVLEVKQQGDPVAARILRQWVDEYAQF